MRRGNDYVEGLMVRIRLEGIERRLASVVKTATDVARA